MIAKAAALFAYTFVVVVVVRLLLTLTSHRTVLKALPSELSRVAPDPMVWRMARAVTLTSRFVPDPGSYLTIDPWPAWLCYPSPDRS